LPGDAASNPDELGDVLANPGAVEVVARFHSFHGSTTRSQGLVSLNSHGEYLVRHAISGRRVHTTRLVIATASGREPIPLEPRAPLVTSGAISRRYVVWQTTSSETLDTDPWVLHYFDRRTRASGVLAVAGRVQGRVPPPVPGYTGPVIRGKHVYWTQVTAMVPRPRAAVFACVISNCSPTRVVAGAALPKAVGRNVYALQAARFGATGHPRIVSISNGYRVRPVADLPVSGTIVDIAATGHHYAFIRHHAGGDVVVLKDRRDATVFRLQAGPQGKLGNLQLTPAALAVAEVSGSADPPLGGYLLIRNTGQLYTLGNTSGLYNITAAGPYVSWQTKWPPTSNGVTGYGFVVARIR
jgi:hypothetical protein